MGGVGVDTFGATTVGPVQSGTAGVIDCNPLKISPLSGNGVDDGIDVTSGVGDNTSVVAGVSITVVSSPNPLIPAHRATTGFSTNGFIAPVRIGNAPNPVGVLCPNPGCSARNLANGFPPLTFNSAGRDLAPPACIGTVNGIVAP